MAIETDVTVRGLSPVQTERLMSVIKKFMAEEQREVQAEATPTAPVEPETANDETATQTAQEAAGEPEGTEWDDDTPDVVPPAPAAPEPAQEDVPVQTRTKQAVDETRLRAMKVTELKAVCERNNVPLPGKQTKDALVAAIIKHCSVPAGTVGATEVPASPAVPTDDPWADESNAGPESDPWGEEDSDPWAEEPAA